MEIARCPECGTDLQLEDLSSDLIRLSLAVGALLQSAAIVGLLVETPQYEAAREGYEARLHEITESVHRTADDLTEWGTAYDEPEA